MITGLHSPWGLELGGFCLPDVGYQGDSICVHSLGICLEAFCPEEPEHFRGRSWDFIKLTEQVDRYFGACRHINTSLVNTLCVAKAVFRVAVTKTKLQKVKGQVGLHLLQTSVTASQIDQKEPRRCA